MPANPPNPRSSRNGYLPPRTANGNDEPFGEPEDPKTTELELKPERSGGADLSFLEYVTCHICNHPFYSEDEQERRFWMTSCGHVLCAAKEHAHISGKCTKCGKKGITTFALEQGLHPSLESWFYPHEHYTNQFTEDWPKMRFQNAQMARYVEYQRQVIADQKDRAARVKEDFKLLHDIEEKYENLSKSYNALQQENSALLKERIAYLPKPQDLQSYRDPSPRQQQADSFVPASTLHYPARSNERPDPDMIGQLGKRPRMEPDYYDRMNPNVNSYLAHATPQSTLSAGRLTMLPNSTIRPASAIATISNEQYSGMNHARAVRTNLDQYRFDPGRQSSATPQPQLTQTPAFQQPRPASAMPYKPTSGFQPPNPVARPAFLDRLKGRNRQDQPDRPAASSQLPPSRFNPVNEFNSKSNRQYLETIDDQDENDIPDELMPDGY